MRQYIFSCSGFRENCTLHIGFQSIILYACHRQIGFYYHFSKHPCIRYELHDTHIGRSSRFIHCLISDRGYFHYLVYRCSFQLKQTIFTTDGSTYKCRIRQRQQHHIGIWQRMVTFIYKFPLLVCADTLIGSNMLTTSMIKYIFIFFIDISYWHTLNLLFFPFIRSVTWGFENCVT